MFKLWGALTPAKFIPCIKIASHILKDALAPGIFAVVQDKVTVSFEGSQMHTCRLMLEGSREVMVLPGLELLKFMADQAEDKAIPHMKAMRPALLAWTVETAQEFTRTTGEEVYHTTLGPKDCLSQPAGWVFMEKVPCRLLRHSTIVHQPQ